MKPKEEPWYGAGMQRTKALSSDGAENDAHPTLDALDGQKPLEWDMQLDWGHSWGMGLGMAQRPWW